MSKRDDHIREMRRLQAAIENTDSDYLKKDYRKAISRMRREISEYDKFHNRRIMANG